MACKRREHDSGSEAPAIGSRLKLGSPTAIIRNREATMHLPTGAGRKKLIAPPDMDLTRQRIEMSIKPDGTMDITIVMNIPRAAGLEIMELAMKHGRSPPPK